MWYTPTSCETVVIISQSSLRIYLTTLYLDHSEGLIPSTCIIDQELICPRGVMLLLPLLATLVLHVSWAHNIDAQDGLTLVLASVVSWVKYWNPKILSREPAPCEGAAGLRDYKVTQKWSDLLEFLKLLDLYVAINLAFINVSKYTRISVWIMPVTVQCIYTAW